MHWMSGVLLYVIVWWMVFFAVLPWGVRIPDKPEKGHADGAPERPMMLRKVLATTAIAAVLWLAAFALIQSDLISFREMARRMGN